MDVSSWTYLGYVRQKLNEFESEIGGDDLISSLIAIPVPAQVDTHKEAPETTIETQGDGTIQGPATDPKLYLLLHLTTLLHERKGLSIDYAIRMMIQQRVLYERARNNWAMRQFIFATVGVLTMLYKPLVPTFNSGDTFFQLDHQGAPCFTESRLRGDMSSRPIVELLLHFGEILPKRLPRGGRADPKDALHVSNLNVQTLTRIGGITIRWVDSVSAHLDFDPISLELMIFRLPSFCALSRGGPINQCVATIPNITNITRFSS